jgi:hypothetical protein
MLTDLFTRICDQYFGHFIDPGLKTNNAFEAGSLCSGGMEDAENLVPFPPEGGDPIFQNLWVYNLG